MSVNYAAEKFGEHLSLAYQTFELSEQIPYSNCPLQKTKQNIAWHLRLQNSFFALKIFISNVTYCIIML